MPLLAQRILRGLIPARFSADRPPARRRSPDRIVFGVKPGHRPSSLPPVRIFLGTERGQFRAERIFLWSIEKHRDPSRIYEVFLMRDLKGFQRRFWLTGFTNYRFAIPELAGFQGRAIYNDADQVYLTDPASLFDTPMGKAGFLSINDRDTSVMLIDCQRMAEAWNAHDVRRLSRKALEARARAAGLWGELDGGWNARDSEYLPGESRLVHFTTLHTQPWRPFPDQFVYFDNPTGELWPGLEREADQAGFLPVNATRPSPDWASVNLYLSSRSDGQQLQTLLAPTGEQNQTDKLRIEGLLEHVPDQDVAWVLARLFRACRELTVAIREPAWQGQGRYRRSSWFWIQQFRQAGHLFPETRWRLERRSSLGRRRVYCGGPSAEGSIAVLIHRKPGHNQQARAIAKSLAEASGRELQEYLIQSSEIGWAMRALLGLAWLPTIDPKTAVVVAGGWLPCRVAQVLGRKQPDLRLVLSGRKAGPVPKNGAVVVQCRHFGLPSDPNRITTRLPLNAGLSETAPDKTPWAAWLSADRKAAALIGGSSRSHRLDAETARLLGRQLSDWARSRKCRLLVVCSRRTGAAVDRLASGLGDEHALYRWQPNDAANPYALALAEADELVVTGESESMLADAASRGRGFHVFPLPERAATPWRALCAWVAERAVRPRFNRRGSIRPQQGITYLCARALERAWILPPRRLDLLHQALYQAGLAAPLDQAAPRSFRLEDELGLTAQRICRQLAIDNNLESVTEHDLPHEQRQPTH
ncbi:MAG: mitochondrial fission ELM1 family protein [Wenzhouxiangella sp.]|nr:mitochondrial fission ELM1 family protein [Wenzhouxiangella sp.]MCH8478854.1 mitochondrial fission ELM1 family protein [Wenzhouxiangella sp.]TVR95774.1 MAG: hypothetical protein EA418_06880 [Wenzhouxiangellaceae bacterium]